MRFRNFSNLDLLGDFFLSKLGNFGILPRLWKFAAAEDASVQFAVIAATDHRQSSVHHGRFPFLIFNLFIQIDG